MDNNTKKSRLLIVDDEPVNIDVLYQSLKTEYIISVATNGAKALKIAHSKNPPDLILLDIMMPEIDGYEVCKQLKSDRQTRKIPIIFLTGKNEVGDEVKGLELGACDYITKPFTIAIVKARVKTHLDRDYLEELVKERTEELTKKNKQLKELINKQHISIDLAKKLLNIVNGHPKRYIEMSDKYTLFIDSICLPCYAEGGDHLFVRTLKKENNSDVTFFSLKDQSGHEVQCVLRSILTDLLHNSMIIKNKNNFLEDVITNLNNEILNSELFKTEDFFTSINCVIDHETLMMRYVSTGHPVFLLIRENKITGLPENNTNGANMPVGMISDIKYTAGEIQLEPDDKLIFYTDGLIEMPVKNLNIMISKADLVKYVEEIYENKHFKVSDIMNNLVSKIAQMCNEEVVPYEKNTSQDDITMICLEIENTEFNQVILKPENDKDINELINSLYLELEKKWNEFGFLAPDTRLRLCLEEVVLNAWKHGNKKDNTLEIIIRYRFGNDFHIEVTDQGNGFDFNALPDPTSQDNLLKSSGRGLFIINNISDNVLWKNNGRTIYLLFKKISNKKENEYIDKINKLMCIWN